MRTRRQRPALSDSESSTEENVGFGIANHYGWPPVDIRSNQRSPQSPSPPLDSFQFLCYTVVIVTLLGAALSIFILALNIGIVTAGVLYPAWQTFRALEGRGPYACDYDDNSDEQDMALTLRRNWASYWVVISVLYTVERFLLRCTMGAFVPSQLYHALLFSVVVYLTYNNAEKSGALYEQFAQPALMNVDENVEYMLREARHHLDHFLVLALVHFHIVLEPVAQRLRYAAARYGRQWQVHGEERPREITGN